MGLTVHYTISSHLEEEEGKNAVKQMRQLALDLPFEKVSKIHHLKDCSDAKMEKLRSKLLKKRDTLIEAELGLLLCTGKYLDLPWNKKMSVPVCAEKAYVIAINVGPGCEPLEVGLARYPKEKVVKYKVEDDSRFRGLDQRTGWTSYSPQKWWRHCERNKTYPRSTFYHEKDVPVPVKGPPWGMRGFCKTQFASNPKAGGIANFLRCHISVVTLLERIGKIPGVKVHIEDEGDYGPGTLCVNYEEARSGGFDPTYRRHRGKHSPAALVSELGDWNTNLAALFGTLKDSLGKGVVHSPISGFPDFEQLEFRGRNKKELKPFLEALDKVANVANVRRTDLD